MKERLDVLLVQQGLAASRQKAKALIVAGLVFVDGQRADKASASYDASEIKIDIKGETLKYVSRGGLKLEKAVQEFRLTLEGKVCMDIGASTGGFTDCMLQNGAVKVYAVDVGRDQLDEKLRKDPRVINLEKTNFRYMVRADIQDDLDFASVDVSFISLTKILLPARNLLKDGGQMVCLIKPQFEAGRENIGKKGVVKEPSVHSQVLHKVLDFATEVGFQVLALDFSPVKGPEGNIEYLVHLQKQGTEPLTPQTQQEMWRQRIQDVTKRARQELGNNERGYLL
ncbi:MAG: TlyA family RNA methyltransferase [Lachnospiraceae bacterium]|nr:TlyA family RNA methyltransferase [Lachnospiraceae bacterium]